MLFVQELLTNISEGLCKNSGLCEPENALVVLESTLGIKYRIWEDLVVLNYCQIKSDKNLPIVQECRSLVLELGTWEVVSRAFDRFFNLGETQCTVVDINECTAFEKVDGSLISVFFWKGLWLYRTKSMIMPQDVINNNIGGTTWKERTESRLVRFKRRYDKQYWENYTFILELTCPENRVVTKYEGTELTLLAVRENSTGLYNSSEVSTQFFCEMMSWQQPKQYSFANLEDCLTSAKDLRNLEEGYVLYHDGVPVGKCKNPAYVAAHHLKGEGCLTEKRVLDLIIMNETDEYLSIFPEHYEEFEPYINAYGALLIHLDVLHLTVLTFIGTQKEFAMVWKDSPISPMAFSMKSGRTIKEAWERLTQKSKRDMIVSYK